MTKDGNPRTQVVADGRLTLSSMSTCRTAGTRPQRCRGDLGLGQLSLVQDKSQLRARDLLVILYIHLYINLY